MLHALSALREVGAMPAIAPIEDLKAALEGFTLCSMRFALCEKL